MRRVGWCEVLSRNRIMKRLDLINASVARMQRFAGMSYDDFTADPDNAAIVESYMRRSLEAVFDVGRHVLAHTGGADLAGEYKSIARGLGDLGVVDRAMSDTLVMMAGYRNSLVHLYHPVSDRELLDIVSENLPDLTRFVAQVDDYLRRAEGS